MGYWRVRACQDSRWDERVVDIDPFSPWKECEDHIVDEHRGWRHHCWGQLWKTQSSTDSISLGPCHWVRSLRNWVQAEKRGPGLSPRYQHLETGRRSQWAEASLEQMPYLAADATFCWDSLGTRVRACSCISISCKLGPGPALPKWTLPGGSAEPNSSAPPRCSEGPYLWALTQYSKAS